MSDYATTKQHMLDQCTTDEAKASIEENYTEALHNQLELVSKQAREQLDG